MTLPIFILHVPNGEGPWEASSDYYAARKGIVAEKLAALGLSFEVVEAVNGNTLTPEQNARIIDDDESRAKYNGFILAPYQRGCALSHIMLYERIVAEGIDEALILEDDAVVGDTLPAVIAARHELPADRGVTLLFHFGTVRDTVATLSTGHRVVNFSSTPSGTVGYFVTQDGARRLLARTHPVRVAADGLTSTSENLYGISPWVVGHKGYDEKIGYV